MALQSDVPVCLKDSWQNERGYDKGMAPLQWAPVEEVEFIQQL
jgi:hypothetical protein